MDMIGVRDALISWENPDGHIQSHFLGVYQSLRCNGEGFRNVPQKMPHLWKGVLQFP